MAPCTTDNKLIQKETITGTKIQRFYAGANVFITGSTGFLGKILIEKLLRSCPDINTLYILVRTKKGKNMYERIEDMFEDVVFEKLKTECPKFRHKVVGISGDMGLPEMGISMQDKQLLKNEVNIVFHAAATVRFDEKIRTAVAMNIKGVQEMLKIAKEMSKLKAFVHVSTLYSQCVHPTIEEKFYPPPTDYVKLIALTEISDDELLDAITPRLIGSYPNTYSYTKSIAEDVIRREAGNLPISIYRPAIVISAYKEPIKGWIDNLYGPTGVTAASSNGLLRCVNVNKDVTAIIIPVDMCVNALISIAWESSEKNGTVQRDPSNYDIPIYQYESSIDSPITWETYMGMTEKYAWNYPSINAIWYYSLWLITSRFWYNLYFFLVHTFPAFIIDGLTLCVGKTPRFLKIYKKVKKFADVIAYFATRDWDVRSERVQNMLKTMEEEDKEIFFCDLKRLDWEDYFVEYFKGVRLYLVKDPLTTLEAAQAKLRKLYYAHQVLKLLSLYVVLRLVWFLIHLFV